MRDDIAPSPGDLLREHLQRHGWTQGVLAEVCQVQAAAISQIVQNKRGIAPEMAVAFGTAFGTGPEIWLQRDAEYRLSKLAQTEDPEVARRARIYQMAPVKEIEKRGWIRPTKSVFELEKELCAFYGTPTLDTEPVFGAVARKTGKYDALTASQTAWCYRAATMARAVSAAKFSPKRFVKELPAVRELAAHPEQARMVPRLLSELGVRMVVVEHLPQTQIDGAAFWLNEAAPVVALSLRHDRIDNFWFTLAHELSHIVHHDLAPVDNDITGAEVAGEVRSEMEVRADREAADFLISTPVLDSFILRVHPLYSKVRIIQFAHRAKVHPGIVVGQLQARKELGWQANREMLVKVRGIVTTTALTDGWGCSLPITSEDKQ